ncbi:MAG: DUF4124 domain-containing protein [Gammaproteobacteria bacterium]|nr:DUF4124 domain-containing protein [Gammaproteobacteria bacterium]
MPNRLAADALLTTARATVAVVLLLGFAAGAAASSAVYRWVDASGITHLSSAKPPAGTKYERVVLASTGKAAPSSSGRTGYGAANAPAGTRVTTASAEQVARRNDVVMSLRNRECVVALESIDRLAKDGQAVEPAEFNRLQQTADQNCSKDPAVRRQQEDMAARLRVSKGDTCIDARNKLADMLEPGRRPTRDQLKTQQEFIESHCMAPVR